MTTEEPKYHGGITEGRSMGKENRPGPLTCRDTGAVLCPRGDLNPHPLYED